MYLIAKRQSQQDKFIAGLVTACLLLGFYLILQRLAVPKMKQPTEVYEEINWKKFNPRPKKITPPPEPVPLKKPETITRPETPPNTVEKIDLSHLKSLALPTLNKPAVDLKNKTPQPANKSPQQKIEVGSSNLLAGFDQLLGTGKHTVNLPAPGKPGKEKNAPGLKIRAGNKVEISEANYGTGNFSLGIPESKEVSSGKVKIDLVDMTHIGGNYEDLSPIYRALVEWMKRHPAQFPEVVNRFMEKAPGDLTSLVNFQIGDRKFQMFLLCKESIYEIRICLVEGSQSTYLIDRGFKERSNYLRVGRVHRTPTGKILSFGTRREAASDRRTRDFYQIFLSWWESVKPEVEQFL